MMLYTIGCYIQHPKEWFKLKHSSFSKEIHRIIDTDFIISVTLKTQQFLCPSNS